jgi:hypothetical protein
MSMQNVYTNVSSNIIYNIQKLEAIQMADKWVDKTQYTHDILIYYYKMLYILNNVIVWQYKEIMLIHATAWINFESIYQVKEASH